TPWGINVDSNSADSDQILPLAVLQLWPPRTWTDLTERALHQAAKLERAAARSNGRLVIVRTRADLDAVGGYADGPGDAKERGADRSGPRASLGRTDGADPGTAPGGTDRSGPGPASDPTGGAGPGAAPGGADRSDPGMAPGGSADPPPPVAALLGLEGAH